MKRIKVSNKYALIDDSDYMLVSVHNWWLTKRGYAYTQTCKNNIRKTIMMHRLIMAPVDKEEVDHKNHDILNNQKNNLRICNRSQNNANMRPRNGYKGVRWTKNRWQAEIKVNGQYKYLGRFKTAKEAAIKYDEEAFKAFGEFSYQNFPKGGSS